MGYQPPRVLRPSNVLMMRRQGISAADALDQETVIVRFLLAAASQLWFKISLLAVTYHALATLQRRGSLIVAIACSFLIYLCSAPKVLTMCMAESKRLNSRLRGLNSLSNKCSAVVGFVIKTVLPC